MINSANQGSGEVENLTLKPEIYGQLKDKMKVIGVIPARFNSQRFPGKPLALIKNKPLIQWVYEGAIKAKTLQKLVVATDDVRIVDVVTNFGGEAVLTSSDHRCGTERVAEVVRKLDTVEIVINIQGDEPLISGEMIDQIVNALLDDSKIDMATFKQKLTTTELNNHHIVKVVVDLNDIAIYFSRSPIPYHYQSYAPSPVYFKHIGLYGYRRLFLMTLVNHPPTPLEEAENLEQLRALELNGRIKVLTTEFASIGVDTPEDIERVESWGQNGLHSEVY